MGDLLASGHLKARGFFATVEAPRGDAVTMPGAPYRHSATPWRIRRRAPRLGEHTGEVLAEAGFSESEVSRFRAAGVIP
jgi:benzylsuccinate CoA-transferase BbsE subunit